MKDDNRRTFLQTATAAVLVRSAFPVALSTVFCLLGNIAYCLGRELRFDEKTERFVGDEEVNQMLTRKFRAPYVVPEKV